MKKISRLFVAAAALTLVASACGPEPTSSDGSSTTAAKGAGDGGTSTTVRPASATDPADKKFCDAEAKLEASISGIDIQSDPSKVGDLIREFAKVAPSEIKADLETVASSYDAKIGEDGNPVFSDEDRAKIEAAGQKVQSYISSHCAPAQPTDGSTPGNSVATLTAPEAGASVTGDTPCPAGDGSSKRTTQFAAAPPKCIDDAKTYTAIFDTSLGKFSVLLDAKAAPIGVNNFVVLARYHFFDGIPFHRIVPDFVIQAGDPLGEPWGTHGPGYTISEEPPADKKYDKYDLAMAKTAEPNSTGSQFFVVTGSPDGLNASPTYSLLGKVVEGTDVVDKIGAVPTAGPSGDSPSEAVVMKSVVIREG